LYFARPYIVVRLLKFSKNAWMRYFRLGKWLTISNTTGAAMNQSDKFLIAIFATPHQLASFSVSSDLIQKGTSLLAVASGSLFPVISGSSARKHHVNTAIIIQLAISLAGIAAIYLFSSDLLGVWLKRYDHRDIGTYLKIMIFGWAATGFGQLFLAELHAKGWMRQAAVLHLGEAFLYLPILYISLANFGILSAVVLWSTRAILDAAALFGLKSAAQ
jgi:O-antigen/teichoic acid export membrane protein